MADPARSSTPVELSGGAYLYNGWATTYQLEVVQAWISAFELDDALPVKLLEPVTGGTVGRSLSTDPTGGDGDRFVFLRPELAPTWAVEH